MSVACESFLSYLDDLLSIKTFPDFPGAINGVQVQLPVQIKKIATSVDACLPVCLAAAEKDADVLLVHHGLFWGDPKPLTGCFYQTIAPLIRKSCGLYSVHLPLDAHPVFGNNRLLAERIGYTSLQPFGQMAGHPIGYLLETQPLSVQQLGEKLAMPVAQAVEAKRPVHKLAVVSGAAGSLLQEAALAGADALLTGEAKHHDRVLARDLGLGLFLAGHYQTETLGVKALGEHLAKNFHLEHEFLDFPTGG